MKKIYIIVYMVLCILFAQSIVAYETMDLEEIKIYVNDERKSGADEGGGDFYATAGDEVKVIIEFYNHNDTITEVEMELTLENIDDGDDIVKDHEWFDVDPDDNRFKEFNFLIPDDARKDDYDLILETSYRYSNGTQEDIEDIEWEMTIREESTSAKEINLESSFDNLTNVCRDMTIGLNNCFGYINKSDGCIGELSICREERGIYLSEKNTLNTDYTECNNERTDLEQRIQNKEVEMKSMITLSLCKEQKDDAVQDKGKDMQQIGLLLAIGVVLAFVFWKKKKDGEDISKEFYKE